MKGEPAGVLDGIPITIKDLTNAGPPGRRCSTTSALLQPSAEALDSGLSKPRGVRGTSWAKW